MPRVTAIVAIGAIALILALAFPTYITAANETTDTAMELSAGGTQQVTNGLEATADAVNGTGSNITLTDTETYQTESHGILTGNTKEYTLQGESINVTVNSTDTSFANNRTVLSIEHNPDYAAPSGAQTITDNMGLLLAIVTIIIGGAAIGVGIE